MPPLTDSINDMKPNNHSNDQNPTSIKVTTKAETNDYTDTHDSKLSINGVIFKKTKKVKKK